ncbi:hypothetical protein B0H11DRAFT_2228161 [Mycena galericulata]|nr:hypothetical protein B0H11DRAFT_2228161 [Mycena galericulata]
MSTQRDEYMHIQVTINDRSSPFRGVSGTVISTGALLGVRLDSYTPHDEQFAADLLIERTAYEFFSRVPTLIVESAIPKVIRSGVDELAHLLRDPRFVRGLEELTILNFDLDDVNIPNSAIMEVLSLVPFLPVLHRVYIHDVTDYSVGNMRLITPVGHKYSEPMRRATDLARMVEYVDRTRSCLPVPWWLILWSVQLFHLRDFTRCLPGAHESLLHTADVWGFYADQLHLRLVSFFFEAFNRPAQVFDAFGRPVQLQTSQEKRRGFVKVHYCGPSHCSDSVAGDTDTNIGLLASTNSMCAYEESRLVGSKGRRIAQAFLRITNYTLYAYVFRVTDEQITWSWEEKDGRKLTVNVRDNVTTIDDGIQILFIDAQPTPPFDALVPDVLFTGEFFVRSSDEMLIDTDVSPFLLETFLRHPALLIDFNNIRLMDRANSDLLSLRG